MQVLFWIFNRSSANQENPRFYENSRIHYHTATSHCVLPTSRIIWFVPSHAISLTVRAMFILFTHPWLGFPRDLFPLDFSRKTSHAFRILYCLLHVPFILLIADLIPMETWAERVARILVVTDTGWCTKRPKNCCHFLTYCASPSEFKYPWFIHLSSCTRGI
jgi:hypothetical protein